MTSASSSIKCEYIYLLREREFAKKDEPIFKIGRTISINTRMNQYPKDSQIFLIEPVDDSVWFETQLIKIFEERYERAKCEDGVTPIGYEYFIGDIDEMIYIIRTFIKYHYPGHLVTAKRKQIPQLSEEYSDSEFVPDEYEDDEIDE